VNFSCLESVLKGISNTCTMNNTSHITQILRDKIERLKSRGEEIQFYWIPGQCGVEVNKRADSDAK
jgi:ribonuclease HI